MRSRLQGRFELSQPSNHSSHGTLARLLLQLEGAFEFSKALMKRPVPGRILLLFPA